MCWDSSHLGSTKGDFSKQSGINGIPAYVIGDSIIEGVQPYEFFQRAMEAALGKSEE
ncbi:hypothetical protein ACFLV0_05790 [Chloroflexota bacterium]